MRRMLLIALLLLAIPGCSLGYAAGVHQMSLQVDDARGLQLALWYPTEDDSHVGVAGNAVFYGQQATVDASLSDLKHPLVLLSHGGFRVGAAVFGVTPIGALVRARLRVPGQIKIAWANRRCLFGLMIYFAGAVLAAKGGTRRVHNWAVNT